MKIGVLAEHFDPARGGLERWTLRFIAWLVERGHEVCAIAIDHAPDALPLHAEWHALPAAGNRFDRATAAANIVNRLALDLVHDMGVGIGADILHLQFGSRVASAEAELRTHPKWYQAWKLVSPAARRRRGDVARFESAQIRGRRGLVIAPSRFAAEPLLRRRGVKASDIRVIYNGVDPERFAPARLALHGAPLRKSLGLTDRDVLFLQVAVNFRLKGVDTTLCALARLPPTAHLAVVGGEIPETHLALARRLGIEGRVHFAKPGEDPVPWFAAADAYVHPSRYDACSLTVLEAWAAGLAVVTSSCNGASELIKPGVEGFVLDDPNDISGLARHMTTLLDARVRLAMEPAVRRLGEACSFDHQFAAIAAVHQELLNAGGATGRLSVPDGLIS